MIVFSDRYFDIFEKRFVGDIKCAAHIINLFVNDMMKKLKINSSSREEIADYIKESEELETRMDDIEERDMRMFYSYFSIFNFLI
jgi:uncharacterized protein Yka (UPF0111/DUF47 family)